MPLHRLCPGLTADPGAGGRAGPKSSSSLLSSESSAASEGRSFKDAGGIAGPSIRRRFSTPSESTFFGDCDGRSFVSSSESRFRFARCGGSSGPTEGISWFYLCYFNLDSSLEERQEERPTLITNWRLSAVTGRQPAILSLKYLNN